MTEHPDPKTRWINMRRMAYIALACAISETVILLALLPRLDANVIAASAGWAMATYLLWGGIIGAYMGVSGTADAWGFRRDP